MQRIGVLALQGDFERHARALTRAGLVSCPVRRVAELDTVSGLVMPGGESTTMLKFFEDEPWEEALRDFALSGRILFGTCAGIILLARNVDNPRQRSLGLLDVDIVRNAYGRQVDSFIGRVELASCAGTEAIFIRAPKISRLGPGVEILGHDGNDSVFVRQGNVFGATFHPELSENSPIHSTVFGQTP